MVLVGHTPLTMRYVLVAAVTCPTVDSSGRVFVHAVACCYFERYYSQRHCILEPAYLPQSASSSISTSWNHLALSFLGWQILLSCRFPTVNVFHKRQISRQFKWDVQLELSTDVSLCELLKSKVAGWHGSQTSRYMNSLKTTFNQQCMMQVRTTTLLVL